MQNAAPPAAPGQVNGQAVAVLLANDKAAFYGCGFYGGQDTLFDYSGRHYFKDCYFEGNIDIISGNGQSVFKVQPYIHHHSSLLSWILWSFTLGTLSTPTTRIIDLTITGRHVILAAAEWQVMVTTLKHYMAYQFQCHTQSDGLVYLLIHQQCCSCLPLTHALDSSIDSLVATYTQSCELHEIATQNYISGSITAQKRSSSAENTGFVFINCMVTGTGQVFLGRAWGPFSRVVYLYTYMNDIIIPAGWQDWSNPSRERYAPPHLALHSP